MKKTNIVLVVISVFLFFGLCACGVSFVDYDKVIYERDKLQADYNTIESEYNELKKKYNKLKSDHNELIQNNSAWLKLTEAEKIAVLALTEGEHITAEENNIKMPAEENHPPEETVNSAETILTNDGFTFFAYPIGATNENLIFSDERFDILNLSFEGEENSIPNIYELKFSGTLNNHSGRDWHAVGLNFCLLDENKKLITSMDAGFTSVGDSINYLINGEDREFKFILYADKYAYDHAKYIALSGLTSFGY